MKNVTEERCDVCARLWPWVEPSLINSVADASEAKHVFFASLIITIFPSGHNLSQTCLCALWHSREILVMQKIAVFPGTEFECWTGIDALGEYMER